MTARYGFCCEIVIKLITLGTYFFQTKTLAQYIALQIEMKVINIITHNKNHRQPNNDYLDKIMDKQKNYSMLNYTN